VANALFKSTLWENAEREFGIFIQKYPNSSRVPEAILFQAEARYKLGQYTDAIALLAANEGRAGGLEDEYLYWIAQAQTADSNYTAAAATFGGLIERFPASNKRLAAHVGQAIVFAELRDWPRVIETLQKPDSVFRQSVHTAATNEWVVEGYLVLGEAQLAQKDFAGAGATLQALAPLSLKPEAGWRRAYLQSRVCLAEGRADEALHSATNLIELAATPAGRAESHAFLARVFEQLNRPDDAIAAYQENLATNAPVEQQRHALLKITELSLAQERIGEAIGMLESYWKQFPRTESADAALLMLGELQLKQYVTSLNIRGTNGPTPATNLLAEAEARFDLLWNVFSNSPLAGKALLNKGWVYWVDGRFGRSEEAFRTAAARLPVSLDQAVARFKWADAQFELGDFAGALTNYEHVVTGYESVPEVREQLLERALYQTVRAALAHNDLAAAEGAMRKILDWFPDGFAGPQSLLLVGQGFMQQREPARARELFAEFEERHSSSPLLPEVRLAVARTYEQEGDWTTAINRYTDWISVYTNHTGLAQAEFSRAWDYYQADRETNALVLFTNFVAQFQTNELVPRAQWWIGDYYFRHEDFLNAENCYQLVYLNTNSASSKLAYEARLMAGRVAVRRFDYKGAIDYFTGLTGTTNCPPDLRARAWFACGDAQMNLDTNRQDNLKFAITLFNQIPATNDLWASAQGRVGDCYLQLAATEVQWYAAASNAYQQVIDCPTASFATRSQARVGLGIVAERLAEKMSGELQTEMLKQALDHYLEVFVYKKSLHDGEQPDFFWVKEAGLKAGSLAERLQMWEPACNIYRQLQQWFPALNSMLEPKILKILKAQPELAQPVRE
jgi:TolA-binding protein